MSKRQDRQGVRTPADVERKYNLGGRFAEILGILNAHKSAQEEMKSETDEMNRELELLSKSGAEMQNTLSGIEDDMRVANQELVNAKNDITGIRADLNPLAEFSDGEYSGIAGFVARANADSTSIGILLEYAQGNDVSLATFMAEAAKEFATIKSLTAVDTKHTNALAGFITEASKTYASIEALASFKTETNEAITGVRQEATDKYATIESLTSLETKTDKAIAGVKSEVESAYAKQSAIVELDTKHTNALAGLSQEVADTYAKISQIAEVVDESGKVTISAIIQQINEGKSSILLSADKIDLSGYVTVNGFQDGTTEINGACIKTGIIAAQNNVMTINLNEGTITAFNFNIDSSGTASLRNAYADNIKCINADVSGKITSSEGSLGGVDITSAGLKCGDTLLSSAGISTTSGDQTTVLAGGVLRFGGIVTLYAPAVSVTGGFLGVYKPGGGWRTLYFDESTKTVKFT